MNKNTKRMVISAVLIALGTVLSMIKVYDLPYGGSITLFGMVPIVVLGYMYGMKWGIFSGFVYSLLQMLLGATMSQAFAGMEGFNVVLMAFLDYILAFTVLGLSGMFKGKIKNNVVAAALGSGVVVVLRLLAHFLSGWILWGSYAEWFFTDVMNNSLGKNILASLSGQTLAVVYSLIYNASYMLPELVVTVVGVVAVMSIKPLRKQIANAEK